MLQGINFTTVHGRVLVESEMLYIKNLRFSWRDSLFGKLLLPMALLTVALTKFVYADVPFDYFLASVWLVLFLTHSTTLYTVLVLQSFSSDIPLNRIRSASLRMPSTNSLEIELRLHLKNGRYRIIRFRRLEKQWEGFLQSLSLPDTNHSIV